MPNVADVTPAYIWLDSAAWLHADEAGGAAKAASAAPTDKIALTMISPLKLIAIFHELE
jgi:hypothetical protein